MFEHRHAFPIPVPSTQCLEGCKLTTIRPAVLEDYAGFASVAQEVHEHHVNAIPDVFQQVDVIVSEVDFVKFVQCQDLDVYVAEDNGEIVGYAVLLHRRTSRDKHRPRSLALLDNFGVLDKSRRLGVGRMQFEECVARANEKGTETLEMDCWEANYRAVQFYQSMGMKLKR